VARYVEGPWKIFKSANSIRISIPVGAKPSNGKKFLRNFREGKVLHERTVDKTAVKIVPNVKVNLNARHSIPCLSLIDF